MICVCKKYDMKRYIFISSASRGWFWLLMVVSLLVTVAIGE